MKLSLSSNANYYVILSLRDHEMAALSEYASATGTRYTNSHHETKIDDDICLACITFTMDESTGPLF